MIKCKEDLINTYIEKGNQELTKLYLDACEPYIDVCLCRADRFPDDSHFYFNPSVKHLQSGECDTERYKKLTLSDLKPKCTRTEYEKVTESIFDLRDEFERGELYCKHEYAREYTQIINTQTLAQALHGGYCFRKVEKEIDWREEVSNFVDDKYSSITIHENGVVDALLAVSSNINFLELCRVALRANGEIE